MFRLLAKVPTVAAWSYKYNKGEPFVYPQNNMGYAENFLYMLHAIPCEEYKPTRSWRARWIASSSCMPTMSRMPPPQRCA